MTRGSMLLQQMQGGLIVSCQALTHEPLYGAEIMARMAIAAKAGGAVGIRANGAEDIVAIREVGLPVIGLIKQVYPGNEVYITPTLVEVEKVVKAGAEIVAVDATARVHPDGSTSTDFIRKIKELYPEVLLLADVSTYEEGLAAAEAGSDLVATTMAGYTPYSKAKNGPDLSLIRHLVDALDVPVVAEGRVRTPGHAVSCLKAGALAVVVGTAITRPQEITRTFTDRIHAYKVAR